MPWLQKVLFSNVGSRHEVAMTVRFKIFLMDWLKMLSWVLFAFPGKSSGSAADAVWLLSWRMLLLL